MNAYLERGALTVEILTAAIGPARRMRIKELSHSLIQRAVSVVQATEKWQSPHRDLIRRLAGLVTSDLDEAARTELGQMLVKALEQLSELQERAEIIRAAIVVGAVDTIESIRHAISAMQTEGWEEVDQLESHFKHRFDLK